MSYEEAEKVRAMIQGHWRLNMDDATCDLWLGALLNKDADIAVKAVARLAKTDGRPPRISDLEEVYASMMHNAVLPPAESCPSCAGDQFVLVGLRKPEQTQWMQDNGHDVMPGAMIEEYAPCPDCNPECNTSFARPNGSVFGSPDAGLVRQRMAPPVVHPIPRGVQQMPDDIRVYLRSMRGVDTEFQATDAGQCEGQCGRVGERYEYGSMKLCEHCCSQRQKIADNLAMEGVVELLKDVT